MKRYHLNIKYFSTIFTTKQGKLTIYRMAASVGCSTIEGGKKTFVKSRGEVCGDQAAEVISTFFGEKIMSLLKDLGKDGKRLTVIWE